MTSTAATSNSGAADLHACGYQPTAVHGLLSLGRILGDAVDDNLISANPVHHPRNRGTRTHPIRPGLTFHELRHSHKPGS